MRDKHQSALLLTLTKIRRAAAESAVRAQLDNDHFFILLPLGNTTYANCSPSNLVAALTKYPPKEILRFWPLTPREATLALEEIGQNSQFNFETIKWKIAEFYSQGHPPKGIDLHNDKVYLNHWPNFVGLPHSIEELRIAALWAIRPTSIVSTATMLQISMKTITAFFVGASATGLVSVNHSETKKKKKNNNHKNFDKKANRITSRLKSALTRSQNLKKND